MEVDWFAVDGWSASRDVSAASFPSGFAALLIDSVIQEPVTDAHVDLASMLYSTEINLRQRLFGDIDALCGFRWIDMLDRYSSHGTSVVTGNVLSETLVTRNHIFAWQLGLDGRLGPVSKEWGIDAYIKGGMALNNATTSAALSDPGNFGSLSASASECHVACFGEAGVTAYVQIAKHVSISAGYQVLCLTDIAQPINQLERTNLLNGPPGTMMIDLGSGLFYHGGNLGLEINW